MDMNISMSYYLSLFPGVSRDKSRFIALAEAVIQQVLDIDAVIDSLLYAYSLDDATGMQLDAIGYSVGLKRTDIEPSGNVNDATFRKYIRLKFALWRWDGTNPSASRVLSEGLPGSRQIDNMDSTVTALPSESLPVPAKELFPVPAGIRAIT